jgi:hypothetical protein
LKYYIYICKIIKTLGGIFRIDSQSRGDYAGIGWLHIRLINKVAKFVNGNVNEVATREDLVAALQNNMLLVEEPAIA